MKHRYHLALLFCCPLTVATETPHCANHPALGKTHFIVDADSNTIVAPACARETLPANHSIAAILPTTTSALFSPDNNVRAELITLIEREREKILVAIYLLSDRDIAQALLEAHAHGVRVELITDPTCLRTRGNKLDELNAAGLPTYVYKGCKDSPGCMHNKFVVFGNNGDNQSIVWTGSFNFTPSATNHNHENVVIIRDTQVAEQFEKQFEKIKKESHVLQQKVTKIARSKSGSSRLPKHKRKVLHHYDSFLARAQC